MPVAGGWDPKIITGALILNGAWGSGWPKANTPLCALPSRSGDLEAVLVDLPGPELSAARQDVRGIGTERCPLGHR
jgi:hypothetical protein